MTVRFAMVGRVLMAVALAAVVCMLTAAAPLAAENDG
jgi:hypothetical protein